MPPQDAPIRDPYNKRHQGYFVFHYHLPFFPTRFCMRPLSPTGSLAVFFLILTLINSTAHAQGGKFPDAHEKAVPEWKGPVFRLSQDYPTELPPPERHPWLAIDFKTQPLEYMLA